MNKIIPLSKTVLLMKQPSQARLIPIRNPKIVCLFADRQNKEQRPIFQFKSNNYD